MIPHRIIQTGPPNLPVLLRSAVVSMQALHPDWDYHFFDDAMIADFLATYFPEYREHYATFRYRIQKYDFFRYLAVYQFGGFYFDLDVFLAEPVTPLVESACVFPFEELAQTSYFEQQFGMDWQIGNYAFGAQAGHPFLAAVIENCVRAKTDEAWHKPMMRGTPPSLRQDFYILNTTGPGMLSRTFAEHAPLAAEVHVLFPEDVCDRASWHQFGSFGVHHMAGSWRPKGNLLNRRMTRAWEQWTERRVITKGKLRGPKRSLPLAQGSVPR